MLECITSIPSFSPILTHSAKYSSSSQLIKHKYGGSFFNAVIFIVLLYAQLLSKPVLLARNGLNLQWKSSQCLLKINTRTKNSSKNIQRRVINVNFENILQKRKQLYQFMLASLKRSYVHVYTKIQKQMQFEVTRRWVTCCLQTSEVYPTLIPPLSALYTSCVELSVQSLWNEQNVLPRLCSVIYQAMCVGIITVKSNSSTRVDCPRTSVRTLRCWHLYRNGPKGSALHSSSLTWDINIKLEQRLGFQHPINTATVIWVWRQEENTGFTCALLQ